MAIRTEGFRTYSELQYRECVDSISHALVDMSEEEREAFFLMLEAEDIEMEGLTRGLEYDREIVDIVTWLKDPYYMGEVTQSIFGVWQDDLIELFASKQYNSAMIIGSLGCVDEATKIITKEGIKKVGDIAYSNRSVLSFDGLNPVYRPSIGPFPKGKGDLYRVVTEHSEFVAFGSHLVFCDDYKYRSLDQLKRGDVLFWHSSVASLFLQDSNEGLCQKEFPLDVRNFVRRVVDSLESYLKYFHQYDRQPHGVVNNDLDEFPSLIGALKYALSSCSEDILQKGVQTEQERAHNHHGQLFFHLSKMDSFLHMMIPSLFEGADFLSEIFSQISLRLGLSQRFLEKSEYHQTIQQFCFLVLLLGVVDNDSFYHRFSYEEDCIRQRISELYGENCLSLLQFLYKTGFHQQVKEFFLSVDQIRTSSTSKVKIKDIKLEKRNEWYWDIRVADTNNYFHDGGFVSHNSGKSTFGHLVLIRMMYEISCLRNPQQTYGLAPGSEIVICNLAPIKETARKVVVEGVMSKIKQSPYFMNEYRPLHRDNKDLTNIKSYEINFPKKISLVAGSSTDTTFIGLNVIGGVVEELNFFKSDPKYMAKKKKSDRWGEFSKAGKIYDGIQRRINSRFMKRGKLPGILVGVSSKTTDDAITARFIKDAIKKKDTRMFVRDRSILDVRKDSFSDETFQVLVGNQHYKSRIIDDDFDLSQIDDPKLINIPVDLKPDFEADISSALRDMAGISTLAMDTFFGDTEKVYQCIDQSREHPFVCWACEDPGCWDSRSHYRIDWKKLAKRLDDGEWEPLINPNRPRVIHLDPALTGDAFGFAMSHIAGVQKVLVSQINEETNTLEQYEEFLPVYQVDFMLKIVGDKSNEILFKNVRQLIYRLSEHGFQISKVTTDKFQSREMIQQLESQGYTAENLSVDEDIEPYKLFRRAVYDGRVSYYKYDPLTEEMVKLEDMGSKIDHTSGNSKDIADAVCGSLWSLYLEGDFNVEELPASKGISESPTKEKDPDDFGDVGVEQDVAGRPRYIKPAKSEKQELKPSYKRIDSEGNESDIEGSIFDTDYLLMRG